MIAPFRVHFLNDGHPDTIMILAENGIAAIDVFYDMVDSMRLDKYDFILNHPLCFVESVYYQSAEKLKNYGYR